MKKLGFLIMLGLTLGLFACGDDGDEVGICIAHYSASAGGDQCFEGWDRELCEEWDNREWISGVDSCEGF